MGGGEFTHRYDGAVVAAGLFDPPAQGAVELADAVGGAVAGVQKRCEPFARDRRFHLAEAGNDMPGLGDDRERIEHRAFQQPAGRVGEIAGHANLALEAFREQLAARCFRHGILGAGDPETAAGQIAL